LALTNGDSPFALVEAGPVGTFPADRAAAHSCMWRGIRCGRREPYHTDSARGRRGRLRGSHVRSLERQKGPAGLRGSSPALLLRVAQRDTGVSPVSQTSVGSRQIPSVPSRLNLRVPRLWLLQPCPSREPHGCTQRSRGTRRFKLDGTIAPSGPELAHRGLPGPAGRFALLPCQDRTLGCHATPHGNWRGVLP